MSTREKRQRVNRACDECKRKKKQCTGSQPCSLCLTRSRACIYSTIQPTRVNNNQPISTESTHASTKRKAQSLDLSGQHGPIGKKATFRKDPATDDETPIQNNERLLEDRGGRLLYIGDSASLSFLQNIRRLIESASGPSSFTTDSIRHTILEAAIQPAPSNLIANMLPDIDSTQYLVNSFFQNTLGILEIFDKKDFLDKVQKTFDQPLDASPEWLCQLNLVLAVGLQLRRCSSNPTAVETRILDRLGTDKAQRAESFFMIAKQLNNSTSGFEEGGIEAVQSLLLMTTYMLTASKRNTAWVYLGTAVRLAYALGIHNQQTLSVFNASEQMERVKVWQSLQIMDCFLSASLGRPGSITSTSRSCPPTPRQHQSLEMPRPTNDLQQSTNVSEITYEVLTRIYLKRKISRSIAYALTLHFGKWRETLPAELQLGNITEETTSPELAIKRLHVNLLYFHGVILLTRPFFLHQVSMNISAREDEPKTGTMNASDEGEAQEESANSLCFHGACVRSAVQTLNAVYSAFTSQELSTKNPFVIYWVFSASLVIMTNTFCPVFLEPESEILIYKALDILKWYGELDAGARRYLAILESFNDVIQSKKKRKPNENQSLANRNISDILFGSVNSSSTSNEASGSQSEPITSNLGWETGARNQMDIASDIMPNLGLDRYSMGPDYLPPGAPNWQPGSGFDEPIDIDWAWFPDGQRNYIPTHDVPLYNPMATL